MYICLFGAVVLQGGSQGNKIIASQFCFSKNAITFLSLVANCTVVEFWEIIDSIQMAQGSACEYIEIPMSIEITGTDIRFIHCKVE